MNLFLSVLRIMLELIDYLILIAPEFVVSALSMSLGNPALIRLSFPRALFFRMLVWTLQNPEVVILNLSYTSGSF